MNILKWLKPKIDDIQSLQKDKEGFYMDGHKNLETEKYYIPEVRIPIEDFAIITNLPNCCATRNYNSVR